MKKSKNNSIGHNLGAFISKYGEPEHLTYDGAAVQVGRNKIFQNHVRKHEIHTQQSPLRIPYENTSEGSICEIKRNWYQIQERRTSLRGCGNMELTMSERHKI